MTIADYQDRTVDVSVYQNLPAAGQTNVTVSGLVTEESGGIIVTGIRKLAQRWLMRFHTIRGSMRFMPLEGCDFMGRLLEGSLRTPVDVRIAFAAAESDIKRSFLLDQRTDDPLDEQYDRAELVRMDVGPGYILLRIEVFSQAGVSYTLIDPLDTTLRGES